MSGNQGYNKGTKGKPGFQPVVGKGKTAPTPANMPKSPQVQTKEPTESDFKKKANFIKPQKADEPTTKTVVITRGLPGSGKSTWAKKYVQDNSENTIRINNDEMSAMLFGENAQHNPMSGKILQQTREAFLINMLKDPSGPSTIIFDNTNLAGSTVNRIVKIAYRYNANVVLKDFLDVPVSLCKERNKNRERFVPEHVIDKMAKQIPNALRYRLPEPPPTIQPYHNDPSLPHVWIIDVDGTLALMDGRSPFDWDKVGEDKPNTGVVAMVKALIASGDNVVIMSGRDGSAEQATREWLTKHVAPDLPLHMRQPGDMRPDSIVKYELFSAHIADKHHVKGVLDDRDQVVYLWREQLKLPTFQVAEGDF